ncbi:hypothetical protein [Cupriavidus gilardii]|uniref:hypothetical protein n=1 Tax=Cupriavidus gilardii TaxID=82541 RepID=UPI0012E856C4|nr:hypothetical protein [Cupriavidus gilardii]
MHIQIERQAVVISDDVHRILIMIDRNERDCLVALEAQVAGGVGLGGMPGLEAARGSWIAQITESTPSRPMGYYLVQQADAGSVP